MIANAADVKSCLERVLALMADRDKINEDIAQVLEDYKPKGVIGKGIRRVATLRRMDPSKRRNDEQLYSDYEDALGALPEAVELVRAGKTYDEAAEATGLSRATVARMVKAARTVSNGKDFETPRDIDGGAPREESRLDEIAPVLPEGKAACENNTTPHHPDTGEITETAPDTPPSPAPEFGVGPGTITESCGGGSEQEAARSPGTASGSLLQPAPQDPSCPKAPAASGTVIARAPDDGESGEASQDDCPATSDCGTTAATPPLGSPEREARPPAISDSQTPQIGEPAGSKPNNDGLLSADSLAQPATPEDDLAFPPHLDRLQQARREKGFV